MQICPKCRLRFGDGVRFCPHDGRPVSGVEPAMGSTIGGQYRLIEELGRGAMGTVYRGWQEGVERRVAIKMLHPDLLSNRELVERFQREARTGARLSHPKIATVYGVGEHEGAPYIAMEYIEGETLEVALARDGRFEVERAVAIAREVASALDAAHQSGVVHRDLKPANILLRSERVAGDEGVVVLDLGVAKLLDWSPLGGNESSLTTDGAIYGTPHYISPEQAGGSAVDHRADVYALGVVLFELVTGALPFEGNGFAQLVAHSTMAPPLASSFLPSIDPALNELIDRCLAKSPDERFATMSELGAALSRLAASEQNEGGDDSLAPIVLETAMKPKRFLGIMISAVLLGLAGLGSGYLYHAEPRQALTLTVPWMPSPEVEPIESGPRRAIMLSEAGYSLRIVVPERVSTGPVDVVIDAWDERGNALVAPGLVTHLTTPDHKVQLHRARRGPLPGRFTVRLSLTRSGRHHLMVALPDDESAVAIELNADGPRS